MTDEFKGARLFLNIPAQVAHDRRIKSDKSILLFGEILSMLNVTGSFYMSNKELAKRLRCTPQTVTNCVSELKKLGYIKTAPQTNKNGKQIGRQIYLGGAYKSIYSPLTNQFIPPLQTDLYQIKHNNKSINKTIKSSSNNPPKKDKPTDPFKIIIHSRKEEEEFIINLIELYIDKTQCTFAINQYHQVIKALMAMKPEDARDLIDQVVQVAKQKRIHDPAAYLISSLRNAR